jgi:hypothetical protein
MKKTNTIKQQMLEEGDSAILLFQFEKEHQFEPYRTLSVQARRVSLRLDHSNHMCIFEQLRLSRVYWNWR